MRRGAGAARTRRTPVQGSRGLLPLSRVSAQDTQHLERTGYIGRFAPSPTGPLHLGSLFAAVTSFLHARQAGGTWLLRIDDIDPPREAPGASDSILRTLDSYALHWDQGVFFQSQRFERYREVATQLLRDGHAFQCRCTRKQLQARGGVHAGVCSASTGSAAAGATPADGRASDTSLRIALTGHGRTSRVSFTDSLQGAISVDLAETAGDYVIMRRDGLAAYHLAVVVDDAEQGITDVVRGIDLLESAAVHTHLQNVLGLPSPQYAHVPVLVNSDGQKLSKQTRALPVSMAADQLSDTAITILKLLGLKVPHDALGAPPAELWTWAARHWDVLQLHGQRALQVPKMLRGGC